MNASRFGLLITVLCTILFAPLAANAQAPHEHPSLWIRPGPVPTQAEALAPGVMVDATLPAPMDVDGDGNPDALLRVHREDWPDNPESTDTIVAIIIVLHRTDGWAPIIVQFGVGETEPSWGEHGTVVNGSRTLFWYQLTNMNAAEDYHLIQIRDGAIVPLWNGMPPRGAETITFSRQLRDSVMLASTVGRGRRARTMYRLLTWDGVHEAPTVTDWSPRRPEEAGP